MQQPQTSANASVKNRKFVSTESSSEENISNLDYSVSIHSYDQISDELRELRDIIYHRETGLLSPEMLIDENDRLGEHLAIRDVKTGRLIAATMFIHAENSDFSTHSGLSPKQLESWFYASRAMVHPDWRARGLYKFIGYLGSRFARINGRKGNIAYVEEGPGKSAKKVLSAQSLSNAAVRNVADNAGRSYSVVPIVIESDYTCAKSYDALPADLKSFVCDEFFGRELRAEIDKSVQKFYESRFCTKVITSTISKREYISALANNHQFVRWTTRLLARISADCSDRQLRNHYLGHLKGEVDHDLWLGNDLETLGADVAYVRDFMQPNTHIGQFMCVQQSAAAFSSDAIQFLSVPIAIEAITAFMPKTFIKGLHKSITSWGISDPTKASSFLTSHIYTDGGIDGHWTATFDVLKTYIRTEKQHQQALHTVKMVFDAVYRAYDSYVEDFPIDEREASVTH